MAERMQSHCINLIVNLFRLRYLTGIALHAFEMRLHTIVCAFVYLH